MVASVWSFPVSRVTRPLPPASGLAASLSAAVHTPGSVFCFRGLICCAHRRQLWPRVAGERVFPLGVEPQGCAARPVRRPWGTRTEGSGLVAPGQDEPLLMPSSQAPHICSAPAGPTWPCCTSLGVPVSGPSRRGAGSEWGVSRSLSVRPVGHTVAVGNSRHTRSRAKSVGGSASGTAAPHGLQFPLRRSEARCGSSPCVTAGRRQRPGTFLVLDALPAPAAARLPGHAAAPRPATRRLAPRLTGTCHAGPGARALRPRGRLRGSV